MLRNCTQTYQIAYRDHRQLAIRLPGRIKSYRVRAVKEYTPVAHDAVFTVKYQGEEMTLYARLMCELGPYLPTTAGTWGINPISIRHVTNASEAAPIT